MDGAVQREHKSPSEKAAVVSETPRLEVPAYVTQVPAGHFAGVSAPSRSLAEARKSAVLDVVRQVLGTIGIVYDLAYQDLITGNPRVSERRIDDRLAGQSKGIVIGAERNVVKSSWSTEAQGRYVYFVLVQFSDKDIAEMRRLSRGAAVVASIVSCGEGACTARITESNGVSVTLTSAEIRIRKRNRFAKTISFWVMHVPSGSEKSRVVAVGPVTVCGGTADVVVPIGSSGNGLSDYLLGAKVSLTVTLKGFDEVGRAVTAKMVF